jgi:hypothetical protein
MRDHHNGTSTCKRVTFEASDSHKDTSKVGISQERIFVIIRDRRCLSGFSPFIWTVGRYLRVRLPDKPRYLPSLIQWIEQPAQLCSLTPWVVVEATWRGLTVCLLEEGDSWHRTRYYHESTSDVLRREPCHQGDRAGVPCIFFIFLAGVNFFEKTNEIKFVFSLFFLSFSLSSLFLCTNSLGSFLV